MLKDGADVMITNDKAENFEGSAALPIITPRYSMLFAVGIPWTETGGFRFVPKRRIQLFEGLNFISAYMWENFRVRLMRWDRPLGLLDSSNMSSA